MSRRAWRHAEHVSASLSKQNLSYANLYASVVQGDRWEKSRAAFTLAEVLITLTIIGVIAALTIPNLMRNMQEHAWHQQWKDNYAMLQNAYKLVSTENPDMEIGVGTERMEPDFIDAMVSHLQIIDSCEPNKVNCNNNWSNSHVWWTTGYKTLRGDTLTGEDFNNKAILLKNGSVVYFGGVHVKTIAVDVNGPKGPNVLGKDLYAAGFDYSGLGYTVYTFSRNSDNQGILIPFGTPNAKYSRLSACGDCGDINSCTGRSQIWLSPGAGCSYKYLYEK